jgi:hypothetical protein
MTLISPLEDLQENTLKAVAGYLRRLEYVARLRDKEGGYSHWGLVRVYGDRNAGKALSQAHREVLSQMLATPLRNLVRDVQQSSELTGVSPTAYLDRFSTGGSDLLPASPGAGSARHLNSVLHALSSLLKNQIRDANPPA